MSDKGCMNVPRRVLFNCIMQTLILFCGFVIYNGMLQVVTVSDQSTNSISPAIEDWSTIPFVSVNVTDGECPSGTESIFMRNWLGIEPGCLVNKIELEGSGKISYQEVMTLAEYKKKCNTENWNAENNINTKIKCSICIPINMEDNIR